MQSIVRGVCSVLFASALSAFVSEARAQEASFAEQKTQQGQDIRFVDDPLSAITSGPIGSQLQGFHSPRRCDLMRPRTTLVVEMLRSIESL